MILRALQALATPPDDAWMVGDHCTDVQAAREAGIRSVFLTYGIGRRGNEPPDRVFSSFAEFVSWALRGSDANTGG